MALDILYPVSNPTPFTRDERKSILRQNCTSIIDNLKNLQKTDSRSRVVLGKKYERAINNFIVPLNLSLIKHNSVRSELIELQASITSEREEFNKKFIEYSQNLENLILTDCQSDGENFLDRLESTKQKRVELSEKTKRISELITKHYQSVQKLNIKEGES